MTVNISYATVDGGVYTLQASYAAARSGPASFVTNVSIVTWGQSAPGYGHGGGYVVDEAFFQFAYAVPSGHRVSAAFVQMLHVANRGSGQRSLMLKSHDWGGTLEVGDFVSVVPAYTTDIHGEVYNLQSAGTNTWFRAGSAHMRNELQTWMNGTYKLVGFSREAYVGIAPTGDERSDIATMEQGGSTYDPRLVYLTTPVSTLLGHLGASAQLSDGTHVYIDAPNDNASPYMRLRHRNAAGTITTLATGLQSDILDTNQTTTSLQDVALVVDPSDNVYLLTGSGSTLKAEAYAKGSGHNWTQKTMLQGNFSWYDSDSYINNMTAAWHESGLTAGSIVLYAMHHPGTGDEDFRIYGIVDASVLLAGFGTLLRDADEVQNGQLQLGGSSDFVVYANETGTGMDSCRLPGSGYDGAIATYNRAGGISVSRYRLADYSNFSDAARGVSTYAITKDSNSKLRVVPINSSTFAVVAGQRVEVWANTTGTTLTRTTTVDLSSQGITSFPTASTLAGTPAWDVVYEAGAQKLWFYYFDVANSRRLLRTSINVVTGLATQEVVEVSAAVGTAGSTMLAIRVPRGELKGTTVLVNVAEKLSGGANTFTNVVDTLNVPPSAPTLTPRANFDATAAATFAWTFNDANAGDTQSAYDFQINTTEGVGVVATGWVVSGTSSRNVTGGTLTNGVNYQWRVRTKDAVGAEGPWSDFSTFSTAAGGNVTITDPVADNPADVITDDYDVSWSVSGTVQASYRIKLIRTDTLAVLSDSGWVAGTATTANVSGMLTDVEHQIQVQVRNGSNVESGVGTRLITPSFGSPEQPTATVQAFPEDGYILVGVINPDPAGDRPQVATNQILRRVSGSASSYTVVGETGLNGTFQDWHVASGVTYEYVVRGVA